MAPAQATVGASRPEAIAVTAQESRSDVLRLDREDRQLLRERAARILQEHPEAAGSVDVATGPQGVTVKSVERFAGATRYETAANLANHYWGTYFWNERNGPVPSKILFVTSGAHFADALSGGAAAAAAGGPLLLTGPDRLHPVTRASIEKLKPDTIVLLGGTAAITAKVEAELQEYAKVARFAGKDRYDVSAALAAQLGYSETAFIASGANYPDGLAGGAAAGRVMAPLLITRPDAVPSQVVDVLKNETFPRVVYVLGGPKAVQESVITQLRTQLPGVTVRRLGGADRYEVAATVAAVSPTEQLGTVASGEDWPDALAGSALAGLIGSKLLLVRSTGVPAPTGQAIQTHKLVNIDVLGGPVKIPEAVVDVLKAL